MSGSIASLTLSGRVLCIEEITHLTAITPFFLEKIKNIVDLEKRLTSGGSDDEIFLAKTYGFMNTEIAALTGKETGLIEELVGAPVYKMVDTCAAEFPASTPYFYSTRDTITEIVPDDRQKVLILGSGPIRIGQGIEFDYCHGTCGESLTGGGRGGPHR